MIELGKDDNVDTDFKGGMLVSGLSSKKSPIFKRQLNDPESTDADRSFEFVSHWRQ